MLQGEKDIVIGFHTGSPDIEFRIDLTDWTKKIQGLIDQMTANVI